MGAHGVHLGGVFSATLANELVEPVAEVVYRAGAQGAAVLVGLAVRRVVVVVVAVVLAVMGVPAGSQRPAKDPATRVRSRPRQTRHRRSGVGGRHALEGFRQRFRGAAEGGRRRGGGDVHRGGLWNQGLRVGLDTLPLKEV